MCNYIDNSNKPVCEPWKTIVGLLSIHL